MEYTLLDFQQKAVQELILKLQTSQANYAGPGHEFSAIVLSAATGAGKTVIATALIEQLLHGGDDVEPQENTTILWVTNDPSLNAQTADKMQAASEKINDIVLFTQGASHKEPTFKSGTVYLFNTQLASKNAKFNKGGDDVPYTIWEIIENTVAAVGERFIVIVDEAHHGVGAKQNKEELTIINRIIEKVPVFIGISATPEKLDHALANSQRVARRVEVPIEDVRDSGLVKDRILLGTAGEQSATTADTTFVRHAVRAVLKVEASWAAYAAKQGEKPVIPALVVQLPNTPAKNEIEDVVHAILTEWPGLKAHNIVNTFGEHQAIDLGGARAIRYMAPQNIQDASDVRVVLAKQAVTTGWDCPRAEVLVSLRKAVEYTDIAQLIGRIVRQPLARRIIGDETLNKVQAFLPRFDKDSVRKVIGQFQTDADDVPTTEMVRITLEYPLGSEMEGARASLASVPTYTVPAQSSTAPMKRLHALAALLEADGVYIGAVSAAKDFLNKRLYWLCQTIDDFEARREDVASGTMYQVQTTVDGTAIDGEKLTTGVRLDGKNINDVYARAARTLKDGTAEGFWAFLVKKEPEEDVVEHKITVAALGLSSEVVEDIEKHSSETVSAWMQKYAKAISDLPESRQSAYDRIRAQAKDPQQKASLTLGDIIEDAVSDRDTPDLTDGKFQIEIAGDLLNRWKRHLYNSPTDGLYYKRPTSTDGLERKVLAVELAKKATVAWYRNPTGGERALCIPYLSTGNSKWRRLHPDFLFVHDVEGELRPSIVDPHGIQLADWGDKLRGYLDYADKHASAFRSINPVTEIEGKLLALALQNEATRAKVGASLAQGDSVEHIFREHGLAYA